ncbi:hypothetical protein LB516_03470 [Mesorhizobium sp. CO1-1-7]|uniref:hypothetical protein n=1 Tax=Mesorhizobium sp. CO1-1-7 TaxID=2876632 RepID=UPI001CD0B9FA|nr:hypothetical protein [Mesorhizobium sp. CO1-1-7]MBZ9744303.1 hypothetical protein [Mesorhizobium sp. CO1-1-7]
MAGSQIPVEVELAFELMPCQAERVAQTPGLAQHACSYFREWGTYHSFDYKTAGTPKPGMQTTANYVGRAPLVPEMLSGCRKAPLMAVGINPNLPGWWAPLRSSLNPLFDDYRQYAHYFRWRGTSKPELSKADYAAFGGGGPSDTPPDGTLQLKVPPDADGDHPLNLLWRAQQMYLEYQGLLDGLTQAMGWPSGRLAVGEDLSYGNMVACPSAKWVTGNPVPPDNLPGMTSTQKSGIVSECFRQRKYFLRQLFQSLPSVIVVFSQNTASTFIGELQGRFSKGDPKNTDTIEELMSREVILQYGDLPDGRSLDARVVFGPHPTGNPEAWSAGKPKVLAQLVAAAQEGKLTFNTATRRLARPAGSCAFCPILDIGPCDYRAELTPLELPPTLTADRIPGIGPDKAMQQALMGAFMSDLKPAPGLWADDDA